MTMWYTDMENNIDDVKTTQLQIRIREDLKDELKVVAGLSGLSLSAMIHSLIKKAVQAAKEESPSAFGIASVPPHRTRYDVYAGEFGDDISFSEWQLLEQDFRDAVIRFRSFKERMKQMAISSAATESKLAEVPAYISGPVKPAPEPTIEDVRRTFRDDEIREIRRSITPRKKKTG